MPKIYDGIGTLTELLVYVLYVNEKPKKKMGKRIEKLAPYP
jgi:hypothetical protein